jgi:hypothetical protein
VGEADLELVRMSVTLGVEVEELREERPAGTRDLRDQDERLAYRDDLLEVNQNDP